MGTTYTRARTWNNAAPSLRSVAVSDSIKRRKESEERFNFLPSFLRLGDAARAQLDANYLVVENVQESK